MWFRNPTDRGTESGTSVKMTKSVAELFKCSFIYIGIQSVSNSDFRMLMVEPQCLIIPWYTTISDFTHLAGDKMKADITRETVIG